MLRKEGDSSFDNNDKNTNTTKFKKEVVAGQDLLDSNQEQMLLSPHLQARMEETKDGEAPKGNDGTGGCCVIECNEESASSTSSFFKLTKSFMKKNKNFFELDPSIPSENEEENCYSNENSHNDAQQDSSQKQQQQEMDEIADLVEEESNKNKISFSGGMQASQNNTGNPPAINYSLFRLQPSASTQAQQIGLHMNLSQVNEPASKNGLSIEQLVLSPSQILITNNRESESSSQQLYQETISSSQDAHFYKPDDNICFQGTTNEARSQILTSSKNPPHHNFASDLTGSDANQCKSDPFSQIHPQTQILDHLADLALNQEGGKPDHHLSGFSMNLPYSSPPKILEETKSENTHINRGGGAIVVVPPPPTLPIKQENNLNEALMMPKNQPNYYVNEKINDDGDGSPNRDQEHHQLHQFSSPSSEDEEGSEGSSNSSSSIDQESPRVINNNDDHEGLIMMNSVNNDDENMQHNDKGQGNTYHLHSGQVHKDSTLKNREDNSFQQVNQSQDEDFALQESTIQEMMRALEEPTNAQIQPGKQHTDALDPSNNKWQQIDYQIYAQPPYGHHQQFLNNGSQTIYQTSNQRQQEQESFVINSVTQYNQGQRYGQVANYYQQSTLGSQNPSVSNSNLQSQIPHHEFQIPDVPLPSSMRKKGGGGISTNQTRRSQQAQDPKLQSQQDQRMLSQSSKDSDSYSRQPQHSNFDDMQQQRLLISGFEGIDLTNQHRQQAARKPSNEPMRNPSSTSVDFKQNNETQVINKKEEVFTENLMECSSSHQSASYQAYKESIQRRVTPMAGQLGGILLNQNHQVFASGSKNNNNNLTLNNLSAQNNNPKTGGILSQVSGASTGTTTSTANQIDQNETVLQKVISAYEEAQTQAQKLEALRGGAVVELALNQAGSKFLQKVLENANPQIVQYLLNEISPMLPEIMVDNYGNYFCQKLLTNCSADQRMQILERISEEFVSICCDKRGTHTVQTFIDLVNLEKEIKYFQRVLHGHVAELSLEVQGTHVIQILIKCFDEQARQFVFDEIYDRLIELSMNNHGLCVVKLIIAKTKIHENQVRMMQKLVDNAIELAQNPYGNYAIQQAFEFWDEEICQEVIPKFFGKIYQLSMQKCSSNVIDKSIQKAKPEYLSKILQELIKCDRLNNLIMNQYGNFVVQNALKFANQEDKLLLSEQIEKVIPGLPDAKIKGKWMQLLKKAAQNHFNFPSGNKSNAIMSTSSRGNQSQRSDNSEERSETSSFHHKKSIFSQNSSQTTKTSQCSYFDARNFKQHQSVMMPPPPKRVQSGIYVPHNQFGQSYQPIGQSMHEMSYPNYQHQNIQGQPPIQQMGPNYPQTNIPFNYGGNPQYPRPNNGSMSSQQYNQQFQGGHPNQTPFQMSQYHGQGGVGQHFQPPPGLHPPIQQGIYPSAPGSYPQAQNFGGPNQSPHYLQQNGQHPFYNHGAAPSHHQGFAHPHQMQYMMNPQSQGLPPHAMMSGGMQGNIPPPGQGFPTQVQSGYDPLNLGGNNYFGSQGGSTNQSSLKRHASDNIQFYASRGLAYHNQNQVTSNMQQQQQQQQSYAQNQGNEQQSRK